jgi:hypothetical protein
MVVPESGLATHGYLKRQRTAALHDASRSSVALEGARAFGEFCPLPLFADTYLSLDPRKQFLQPPRAVAAWPERRRPTSYALALQM